MVLLYGEGRLTPHSAGFAIPSVANNLSGQRLLDSVIGSYIIFQLLCVWPGLEKWTRLPNKTKINFSSDQTEATCHAPPQARFARIQGLVVKGLLAIRNHAMITAKNMTTDRQAELTSNLNHYGEALVLFPLVKWNHENMVL